MAWGWRVVCGAGCQLGEAERAEEAERMGEKFGGGVGVVMVGGLAVGVRTAKEGRAATGAKRRAGILSAESGRADC